MGEKKKSLETTRKQNCDTKAKNRLAGSLEPSERESEKAKAKNKKHKKEKKKTKTKNIEIKKHIQKHNNDNKTRNPDLSFLSFTHFFYV